MQIKKHELWMGTRTRTGLKGKQYGSAPVLALDPPNKAAGSQALGPVTFGGRFSTKTEAPDRL